MRSNRHETLTSAPEARRNAPAQPRRATLAPGLVAAVFLVGSLLGQSPNQVLADAERHRLNGDLAKALGVLESAAAKFPDSPLIHFNHGAVLGELNRNSEAAEALGTGLALDPSHAEARLTLAKVLVRGHRFGEALEHLERYAALVGQLLQGFDAHYARGLALRRLGRLAEAEAELRRALDIDPGHADALLNLGAVLDQRGADEEAVAYLRKAANLQPRNADVRYRLARVLMRVGETEQGRSELARFQELRDRDQLESRLSVLMRAAEKSMRAGDPGGAKELYQQVIRQDSRHVEAHVNLGVAYERLGLGDLAEAMFRKTLELQADHAEARLNLGLKQAEAGRFPDALSSLRKAVQLAPQSLTARKALAMVLTRLKRPQEAIPQFERIVQEDPSSAEAHLDLGIALAESGNQEKALAAFDKAARLAPDSFRPHYNRGRALNDLGHTVQARQALEAAIALSSRYAPALHLLGTIERAAGDAPRAVELLRAAAELDPGNPLVHYDLGLAASEAGQPEKAIHHWEAALSLDPHHKESLYNLAQALHAIDPRKAREYREHYAALKAEEQDTDRAGTLWNFALAEAEKEQWAKAFELFRQALDACGGCPARGQIHKNFGLVYGHSGDYERAAAELIKALDLLPEDEEIKQALEVVRPQTAP